MKLQIFNNTELGSVRSLMINNNPWFVGKDICTVFGDKNHNRSLGRVDAEDKREEEVTDSLGRTQKAIFVNESGLYSLLFSMQPQKTNNGGVSDAYPIEVQERIEKIHKFKRWVTSEVLPSIRKHGIYAVDEVLNNPDMLINALQELKAERERTKSLTETVAVQKQQITEMQPKASYYDVVINCKDLVAISVIAKDYGWSAKRMNRYLHEKGVQYKQGDIWLLYQKYAEMGYTNTKTHSHLGNDGSMHTTVHTYWTQSGRLFIYSLLKNDGIVPRIEKE